eukprot:PhF_6_TR37847/c0_g2_i2/m.56353
MALNIMTGVMHLLLGAGGIARSLPLAFGGGHLDAQTARTVYHGIVAVVYLLYIVRSVLYYVCLYKSGPLTILPIKPREEQNKAEGGEDAPSEKQQQAQSINNTEATTNKVGDWTEALLDQDRETGDDVRALPRESRSNNIQRRVTVVDDKTAPTRSLMNVTTSEDTATATAINVEIEMKPVVANPSTRRQSWIIKDSLEIPSENTKSQPAEPIPVLDIERQTAVHSNEQQRVSHTSTRQYVPPVETLVEGSSNLQRVLHSSTRQFVEGPSNLPSSNEQQRLSHSSPRQYAPPIPSTSETTKPLVEGPPSNLPSYNSHPPRRPQWHQQNLPYCPPADIIQLDITVPPPSYNTIPGNQQKYEQPHVSSLYEQHIMQQQQHHHSPGPSPSNKLMAQYENSPRVNNNCDDIFLCQETEDSISSCDDVDTQTRNLVIQDSTSPSTSPQGQQHSPQPLPQFEIDSRPPECIEREPLPPLPKHLAAHVTLLEQFEAEVFPAVNVVPQVGNGDVAVKFSGACNEYLKVAGGETMQRRVDRQVGEYVRNTAMGVDAEALERKRLRLFVKQHKGGNDHVITTESTTATPKKTSTRSKPLHESLF